MIDKKIIRRKILALVMFIITLCLVEFSSFSENAIALTNGGYGVLDMKIYNSNTFIEMMKSSNNISIYWKYYLLDSIFTVAFLNFMIQMVSGFEGPVIGKIKNISFIMAAIRALLDFTENGIMLNQIYSFPNVNNGLINACNIITRMKFSFMRGWILCFFTIIIIQGVQKRNEVIH